MRLYKCGLLQQVSDGCFTGIREDYKLFERKQDAEVRMQELLLTTYWGEVSENAVCVYYSIETTEMEM